MKTTISKILCMLISLQMAALPALANASRNAASVDPLASAKLAIQKQLAAGWKIQKLDGTAVTVEQLDQKIATDFLIAPPEKDGSDLVFRIKNRPSEKMLDLAIAAYRKNDLRHRLASRVLQLDSARGAVKSRVEMEQALQSMALELEKYAAAQVKVTPETLEYIAFGSAGLGVLVFLSTLTPLANTWLFAPIMGNTKTVRIVAGVLVGAGVVLFCVALGTSFLEKSAEARDSVIE
ncbi:MAG: hypothetical protein HYW49_06405 [Deltaproteobacteria bacterium]|nr:hypothetical protein [Deltaproteobacteria bacterium]